ncbi:glycoside hydrolase family 15 protein, partial [Candidatus Microgenomates bacterium]|nr:glycoside hydrolase family 15 protein [Candidatus Microgenomates bacterium]
EMDKTDLIPKFGLKIVRKVKALTGDQTMKAVMKLTPDFARVKAKITRHGDDVYLEDAKYRLVLHGVYEAQVTGDTVTVAFKLKENEDVFFGLSLLTKEEKVPTYSQKDFHRIYRETEEYWEWWMAKCSYEGPYKAMVQRSALTLKLMIFEPTGSIVAAITTSIPEKLGGVFNWDYRFTWLRDASFTVYAFIALGYLKEAERFIHWLEKVCLNDEEMPKIMYGIHGERKLTEIELPHLEGYMKSPPVRLGNGAADQKQFDIFGEVLNAIYLYINAGGVLNEVMQGFVVRFVDYCCRHWTEPDAGIWENRGGDRHHTYSKLMCWTGVDRGIRIAEKLGIKCDLERWNKTKEEIKADLLEKGYDKKLGAFVDAYGSTFIDASLLNVPIVGLLPASDPRVLSTIDKVMSELEVNWFLLRTSDNVEWTKQGEGAFFLPTFWLIDNLSLLGRTAEAKVWLDKIIRDATPLGHYAEEFDPVSRIHLGNFPQAFTHLGLINSILTLHQAEVFGREQKTTNQSDRLHKVLKTALRGTLEPQTKRSNHPLNLVGSRGLE